MGGIDTRLHTHNNKAAAAAAHCHWLQGEPPAAHQELIDAIELLGCFFFVGALVLLIAAISSHLVSSFLSLFIQSKVNMQRRRLNPEPAGRQLNPRLHRRRRPRRPTSALASTSVKDYYDFISLLLFHFVIISSVKFARVQYELIHYAVLSLFTLRG